MIRPRTLLAVAVLALSACAPAAVRPPAPMPDAETLIRTMRARYHGRWYGTIVFSQKTTRTPPGGPVAVETWREYGAMPGRLRIEMGPAAEGRGVIFSGDSTFVIRGGSVAARRAGRNPLMTLGFDIYVLPVEESLRLLREQGFPDRPVRLDTWQGRPAYVVGGAPGDLKSKQYWIDADRLVFVRMLGPSAGDSTRTEEIRFNRYYRTGGGWVAPEVEVLVDGTRVFFVEYSDVRVNVPLSASLFIPEQWKTAAYPRAN